MKRMMAIVFLIVQLVALIGCKQPKLTLDRVVELSEKGDQLTWSDFEKYEHIKTGSGLYIWVFDVYSSFELVIGGGSLEEPPMYIYLSVKSDEEKTIDIRKDDVRTFIEENR